MRTVSVDWKYDRYDRSRKATCLWCVWSLCLSVSGSMFRHPAKGIRVLLWFFFWLHNSHLTAEIVQGRIRDSRPPPLPFSFCLIWTKTWSPSFLFVPRPPKSLLVSHFLSYLSFQSHLNHSSFPLCVCGDSGVKLRWVKPGRWVTHGLTHDTSTCSWRQDFPLDSLSNYQDNCLPCCGGSFLAPRLLSFLKGN